MPAPPSPPIRIALVGDYDPEIIAHVAIERSLARAARELGLVIEPTWIATPAVTDPVGAVFAGARAIWVVPGSPYVSMDGALRAIRHAREQGIPFLGTCGGFQHAVIEYARDVMGLAAADHAESNPGASLPLVAPLACSLVEQRGAVRYEPGTRLAALVGEPQTEEGYHCSYGLNPAHAHLLDGGLLRVAARDLAGDVRAVELHDHPFYVATLFQPERAILGERLHPIVRALVTTAVGAAAPALLAP